LPAEPFVTASGQNVVLRRLDDYSPDKVATALEELLAPLGGMAAFVRPGQQVLLKPNMLAGKAPKKAVTTHPELVRAVILAVQRAGGSVSVGDSPGVGQPRQVAKKCGILEVIEATGARFAPFADSVKVRPAGGTFHELEIARDILDADLIINLPKLKTHQMMGLTCAVKNLFGAVVGMRKPRLHLQAGSDKAFFALMLLELAEQIRPALNIVDAVVGMEGDGPGSGDPVQIGALLAGSDAQAVDTVATELVGFRPQQVWTQHIAARTGRPLCRIDQIRLLGDALDGLRPRRFRPAKSTDVNFGLPAFLERPLKNSLTARPVPDFELCQACNLCVRHCPPKAMELRRGKLVIDYQRCIRCFCCQELCPHGALLTEQGLLLRLVDFLGKTSKSTKRPSVRKP
jgi:uncharacterized protein (DUF362 family)/Pyruvate/2-oxoacid:ferredoxin oxidoreductase delta subunit